MPVKFINEFILPEWNFDIELTCHWVISLGKKKEAISDCQETPHLLNQQVFKIPDNALNDFNLPDEVQCQNLK